MDMGHKKYAVVKFISDSTFSEIPLTWLCEDDDNQQCWWPPRTSNVATLITNYTSPNYKTWNRYEVDIIKYCTSLEAARKSAADGNYVTTDEDRLGRGKREHVQYNRYSDDDDSDDNDKENDIDRQAEKYITKKKSSSKSTAIAPLPLCPSNFGLLTRNNNVSQSEIANNNITIISNDRNIALPSTSYDKEQNLYLDNIPIIVEGCNNQSNENVLIEEKRNFEDSVHQMLRMQAACNFTLRAMNQRLAKVENAIRHHPQSHVEDDNNIIASFLPLKTLENIKEFNSLLKTSDDLVKHFKQLLSQCGGNNAKDNIYRCLKKIFTNECAMKCSWKGLRNNFRVSNLYMIGIMRKVASYYNCTDMEFDNTVSEWLRFAKQRNEREKNKQDAQDEGN